MSLPPLIPPDDHPTPDQLMEEQFLKSMMPQPDALAEKEIPPEIQAKYADYKNVINDLQNKSTYFSEISIPSLTQFANMLEQDDQTRLTAVDSLITRSDLSNQVFQHRDHETTELFKKLATCLGVSLDTLIPTKETPSKTFYRKEEQVEDEDFHRANQYEPSTLYTNDKNVDKKAGQHSIFTRGRGINKGVYPGSTETPAILIDDVPNQGPKLRELFKNFTAEIEGDDSAHVVAEKALKFVRKALPLSQPDTAKSELKKLLEQSSDQTITLQKAIEYGIGTPTMQSLLLAYLLEKTSAEKNSFATEMYIERSSAGNGGHAYVKYYNDGTPLKLDPALSVHPMYMQQI